MRTVRGVGFGLVLLAGIVSTAMAQNFGGINPAELFQQLDANNDMVIERGEVPESGREAFATLVKNGDRNQDGKIDREEYRSMLGAIAGAAGKNAGMVAQRLRAMDKDNDGKVSKDEFTGDPATFDRFDTNKDGFLTPNEGPGGTVPGSPNPEMVRRLRAMDKDGDGKVSKDEFTGEPDLFDRLDRNKDGVLNREDNPDAADGAGRPPGGAPAAGGGERFRAMDKDGDGKVSKGEFEGPAAFFDRLDADRDGSLSLRELSRMPGPGGAGAGNNADRGERLRAMDKNNDGKISKDEFEGPAQFFDRLDADSDGVISTDEIRSMSREPGKSKRERRPDAKKS